VNERKRERERETMKEHARGFILQVSQAALRYASNRRIVGNFEHRIMPKRSRSRSYARAAAASRIWQSLAVHL
jgi:hypothetical protein